MDSEVVQMVVGALVASGVGGAFWRVVRAWLRAFERAGNQKWVGDSQDDDDEVKVQRVTDSWKKESRVPRFVLEHQVRRSKDSGLPPRPGEPPPD